MEKRGVEAFLLELRTDLRSGRFQPQPVRAVAIPKASGGQWVLGIPTLKDRLCQMALKLVLEPIYEADFASCSYGFRPQRSAHDALAELRYYGGPPRNFDWAVEGDIKSCFDRINHEALMQRVRRRVKDRKVLRVIRAFLEAGLLRDGAFQETRTGTPQGGILSPLLANVLLDSLDQAYEARYHALTKWERQKRHRRLLPLGRLIRYADDFVVLILGTREDAERERVWLAEFLRDHLRLELHPGKTHVTPLSQGVDFLGYTSRKARARHGRFAVTQYPSRPALARVMQRMRGLTVRSTTPLGFDRVHHALNRQLRGWTEYFRYGSSAHTFGYVEHWLWHRVYGWLGKRHRKRTGRWVFDRYGGATHWRTPGIDLFRPTKVTTRRWLYRGHRIPSPWTGTSKAPRIWSAGNGGEPDAG